MHVLHYWDGQAVASTHGGHLHILEEIQLLNMYVYCQINTRDWKIFDVMKLWTTHEAREPFIDIVPNSGQRHRAFYVVVNFQNVPSLALRKRVFDLLAKCNWLLFTYIAYI
jgi:hypothetical protein